MDKKAIVEALNGCGSEIRSLIEHVDDFTGFLDLVSKFASFPNIARRPAGESRSLIEIVSKGKEVTLLENELELFFTSARKPAGKSIPFMLRFSPLVKYLGGVRKEQAFYSKKSGAGEFYAALWPWKSTPDNITVHFGYFCETMPPEDYERLRELISRQSAMG